MLAQQLQERTPFAGLFLVVHVAPGGVQQHGLGAEEPVAIAGSTQTGDPHWLGILEYPNAPHSATNHFTSRYTYMVVPAGKTLDVNLIHNQARRVGAL